MKGRKRLTEDKIQHLAFLRMGVYPNVEYCCPLCDSDDILTGLHIVLCGVCGSATESWSGRLGEYQREVSRAAYDWNEGRVE